MFFPRNFYSFLVVASLASLVILCSGVSAAPLKETDLEAVVVDKSDTVTGSIIDTEFSDTHFEDEKEDVKAGARRRTQSTTSTTERKAGARRKTQSTTSTTERKNIFQKLGESLIQSIIGCLLIVCVPFAIWKNEGRHVDQLVRIDFCKNNAVVVDCNTSSNENVGSLVHFTGNVTVGDSAIDFGPSDTTLNLNLIEPISHAILLRRTCYIYQTFEVADTSIQRDRIGGGETRTTTYRQKDAWSHAGPQNDCPNIGVRNSRGIWDRLVAATAGGWSNTTTGNNPSPDEATAFLAAKQNQGCAISLEMAQQFGLYDPTTAPQARAISSATRVGEFALTEKVVVDNPAVFTSEYTPVPMEYLPNEVPGCDSLCKGSDNALRTFKEGQEPQNGDIKIVYEYVADGIEASFIVAQTTAVPEEARIAGAKFGVDQCAVTGRCNTDLGQIWMIRKGIHNLYEMLDMAKEEENAATKIGRIVFWVLLCAGWIMLFAPFLTVLQVLPLLSTIGGFAVVVVAVPVSLLCCVTIMVLAYMRYRPVITGALLAVVLGVWGIVAWRLDCASELSTADEETNVQYSTS